MKKIETDQEKANKIVPITLTVTGDEKAWGLYEIHDQSPGNRGFHRYQIIMVNRDDRLVEFRRDMGLAKKWKGVKQLRIPSYFEHTVDELMDLADELRKEVRIDLKDWLGLETYKAA